MRGDLNRWFTRELKKVVNEAIDLQEEFKAYVVIDAEEFDEKKSFLDDIQKVLNNLSELEDVYQDLHLNVLPKKLPKETRTWDDFSMYGKDAMCTNSKAFWGYLEMLGYVDIYTDEDGIQKFYFDSFDLD
jgi:hypothetical protein